MFGSGSLCICVLIFLQILFDLVRSCPWDDFCSRLARCVSAVGFRHVFRQMDAAISGEIQETDPAFESFVVECMLLE